MIQDIRYFDHTLSEMNITGMRKRFWLKQFKSDPQKTTQQFYDKLERMYSGWRAWEIAKILLINKYPNLAAVPEHPVPKISVTTEKLDLDYFLEVNNGKWGDAHFDYDQYLATQ